MTILEDPSIWLALVALAAGVVLIWVAGDQFVEGAASLAKQTNISPLVIGVVVVGFGTSAPEMLVSGLAASGGELDLGVGNIVGSNIANLTLVLGSAAIFTHVPITKKIISKEAVVSLAGVVTFAIFMIGELTAVEGLIMLGSLGGCLWWILTSARSEQPPIKHTHSPSGSGILLQTGRTVGGLIATVIAARVLVWSAIEIATQANLSGGFVGLSIVAVGTSLPELVTAVVAAKKQQTDLVVGNLLGSNLFNSLAVGGIIAVLGPGSVNDERTAVVSIVVMLLVSFGTVGLMVWRKVLERPVGLVLIAVWVGTIAYLGVAS